MSLGVYGGFESDEEYYSPAEDNSPWMLEREIGKGGFGLVKLYINQTTQKRIVLKECRLMNLSQENIERWHRELELTKRFDHPNIVKSRNLPEGFQYSPRGNTPYICMEYCDGGDLRHVLRDPENCCGLREVHIRQLCHDIKEGIRFLHSQKVIHRDLKPENILIKKLENNEIIYKLTDFGYAKTYDQSSVCDSLVGTVQYVAPEVLQHTNYNSSVDFWSFGVVVFECITGKRPFLHGDQSPIGWYEFVAKKDPDVIYIYWGKNDHHPECSKQLPQPHRLSRPFEELITSWLRTVLHFNPKMRGGRRTTTQDAPCLINMDDILQTKVAMLKDQTSIYDPQVVNSVCTSTGEVYPLVLNDDGAIVSSLKSQIHTATGIPPKDFHLVLANGKTPMDSDLAVSCIQSWNVGTVYIFTTSVDPSFKMIHSTNSAVSRLTAYGDEGIPPENKREAFAHVFFHIREHHSYFVRLHEGHRAILTQIDSLCGEVRTAEQALVNIYNILLALLGFITDTHLRDCEQLSLLHNEKKILPPAVMGRTLKSWRTASSRLEERQQELRGMSREIAQLRQETETYIRVANEVCTSHQTNGKRLSNFYHSYVVKAKDLYHEAKINRGYVREGKMQDILLGATHEAGTMIEDNLNGINFASSRSALEQLVYTLQLKKEYLNSVKTEITQIDAQRRQDIWQLLQHENTVTPFSPIRSHPGSAHSSSAGSSETHPLALNNIISSGSGRSSDIDYSRQTSEMSVASAEASLNDPALLKSLTKFQRCVSQEENDKVLEENKVLLTRLHSLLENTSMSPSHSRSGPNGHAHTGVSTIPE